MTKTIDKVKRFMELTRERDRIREQLRPVEKERSELESQIVTEFMEEGQQSVKVAGATVFLRREISVSPAEGMSTRDMVERFRRARLGELIGINHPTLKKWAKERMFNEKTGEWECNPAALPPSIREIVNVTEFSKLSYRKA